MYNDAFKTFLKYMPEEKQIGINHIIASVIYYYFGFSNYYAAFDEAMNADKNLSTDCVKRFNLFMSKAKCATCHFVPNFNGVKPPKFGIWSVMHTWRYGFTNMDNDSVRYQINPANETLHAFGTGFLRNIIHTAPYMHNGVFKTLHDVLEFYNNGEGVGKKFAI